MKADGGDDLPAVVCSTWNLGVGLAVWTRKFNFLDDGWLVVPLADDPRAHGVSPVNIRYRMSTMYVKRKV